MKKLRELMAIMAIMATAVAMTGCGSDDDDDDDDGPPAATAPATLAATPYYFTAGGITRSITFAPNAAGTGGAYTVTEGANGVTEQGTYTYTTNSSHAATLSLTGPNSVVTTVNLNFSASNTGTYTANTPDEQPESGTFSTVNPGGGGNNQTNPPTTNPPTTNPPTTNNPPTGDLTVVGRRVQIQYGEAAGSPGELFEFRQDGTFTSDFEPGAGGTYTTTASGNTATVNINYTAPAHANGDTATFNLNRTSDTGGSFTGTTVYGGTSSGVTGPWSFAQ